MSELVRERLSDEEKRWIAEEIDAELRRRAAESPGEVSEPDLMRALARMNVVVSELTSDAEPPGCFTPAEWTGGYTAVVSYNPRRTRPGRAQVLAHELSHFLMSDWVAPRLYGVDRVLCPGDSAEHQATREEIARAVDQRWKGEG